MAKPRIGEILIEQGKIDDIQLQSALGYQKQWGNKLGECFVRLGILTEKELCHLLSKVLKIPMIDITRINAEDITRELLKFIDAGMARNQLIVPVAAREVKGRKRLVVATSDPTNYKLFDELQFKTSLPLLVMISPASDIEWFVRRYYLMEVDTLAPNYTSVIQPRSDDEDGPEEGGFVVDSITSVFDDPNFKKVSKDYLERQTRSGKKDKE